VGTKAWIVYGIICVVVIATVLVMMLVLVPQATSTGLQAGSYEALAKQEFTFDGSEIDTLKKQYGVTQSDVDKGLKTDKYEEGNINPFTPKKEVTIYNEPTLKNDLVEKPLTPDSK